MEQILPSENIILLKNTKIYDRSGAATFQGDVLICDDRIVQVAPNIEQTCEEIDLPFLFENISANDSKEMTQCICRCCNVFSWNIVST